MPDEYGFMYEFTGEEGEAVAVMLIIYLVCILFSMLVSTLQYVLQSLGLYTIAKRRGIRNPWLAWIPVGNSWMIGCISDQYQYVVKGKVRNKRKVLLVLNILTYGATAAFFVYYIVMMGSLIGLESSADVMTAVVPMLLMLFFCLVMAGVSVAVSVVTYLALYDLYTSCDPKNNILYLILSIFFSITMPIFVFVCRKKDLGMPPRKPKPAVESWTPVEDRPEPWENNPEA